MYIRVIYAHWSTPTLNISLLRLCNFLVSVQEDDEDELIMMESEDEDEDDEALSSSNRKRPLTEETHQAIFKKARLSETDDDTKDDNLVVLES